MKPSWMDGWVGEGEGEGRVTVTVTDCTVTPLESFNLDLPLFLGHELIGFITSIYGLRIHVISSTLTPTIKSDDVTMGEQRTDREPLLLIKRSCAIMDRP